MEKRSYIPSSFEQIILLVLIRLRNNAYGVAVRREAEERAGCSVSIGAVYAALERLEEKGLVSSRTGEASPERGGRAKRYYKIEAPGQRVLVGSRRTVKRVWVGLAPVEA